MVTGYTRGIVSPRDRWLLAVLVLLALSAAAAGVAPERWPWAEPPLLESPGLVAHGRQVLGRQCLGCHDLIPLAPRVKGWDVRRAYQALGELPRYNKAMPGFFGTDEERRALAAWLAAAARGEVTAP
jgi:mono/diheme cytochrome c family protein